MDEVYPCVFVGNANHAIAETNARSVESIITLCTFEIAAASYDERDEYIPFDDDDTASMSQLSDAVSTVVSKIESGERILVHCNAGISRSPTVVATAIAICETSSFEDGLNRVIENRSKANPNPALVEKITELYPELFD